MPEGIHKVQERTERLSGSSACLCRGAPFHGSRFKSERSKIAWTSATKGEVEVQAGCNRLSNGKQSCRQLNPVFKGTSNYHWAVRKKIMTV